MNEVVRLTGANAQLGQQRDHDRVELDEAARRIADLEARLAAAEARCKDSEQRQKEKVERLRQERDEQESEALRIKRESASKLEGQERACREALAAKAALVARLEKGLDREAKALQRAGADLQAIKSSLAKSQAVVLQLEGQIRDTDREL